MCDAIAVGFLQTHEVYPHCVDNIQLAYCPKDEICRAYQRTGKQTFDMAGLATLLSSWHCQLLDISVAMPTAMSLESY